MLALNLLWVEHLVLKRIYACTQKGSNPSPPFNFLPSSEKRFPEENFREQISLQPQYILSYLPLSKKMSSPWKLPSPLKAALLGAFPLPSAGLLLLHQATSLFERKVLVFIIYSIYNFQVGSFKGCPQAVYLRLHVFIRHNLRGQTKSASATA